jgi:hypothetical protein
MANLTAAEFRKTRQMIGDLEPTTTGRQDLSNDEIQEEWDRAAGHSSERATYLAYYYMLERRWGVHINATDTDTLQGTKSQSQIVANIEKLMKRYESKAGVADFVMSVTQGTFDFGLDQDDPITGADLEE